MTTATTPQAQALLLGELREAVDTLDAAAQKRGAEVVMGDPERTRAAQDAHDQAQDRVSALVARLAVSIASGQRP